MVNAKSLRAMQDLVPSYLQLLMIRIDHVNSQKDELAIALKALPDTAKQQVSSLAKKWKSWEQTKK